MNSYIGEIKIFAGNYAPEGWLICNGQSLSVNDNQVLFNLLGNIYGGDGVTKFNLPDLRGRLPINQGQGPGLANYLLAQTGGIESVTLTAANAAHGHSFTVSAAAGTTDTPGPTVTLATLPTGAVSYVPFVQNTVVPKPLNPATISNVGSSGAHNNQMPTTGMNYIICTSGLYPEHP